jgi:putative ABC transport system permease protein
VNLLLTLRVAYRALRKNKMRAGLTVLGVVIGIAAVTAMVSLGQSASFLLQGALQGLGTNLLVVYPKSLQSGGVSQGRGTATTLTAADCKAIVAECPSVLAATPHVRFGGQVIYGNTNWKVTEMLGVGAGYLTVANWQLRRGGFFTDHDITAASKVCVVGQTVVEKLFQTSDPLGKTIRIQNIPFQIIGILEKKGANLEGGDKDNIIVAPFTTVRKRIQGSAFADVGFILVSARSSELMTSAKEEIMQLLYDRHRIRLGDMADFGVNDLSTLKEFLNKFTLVMTLLLAAIAGISLVVGGVGIMNIMLVSVTERTREIGIRMAVGARGRDILRQFLVEAVLLSSIGGLVGVLLGAGASALLTAIINALISNSYGGTEWPVVVSLRAAVIAMLFAGAVGIFFGYYPARRASRLDPIEALRYE